MLSEHGVIGKKEGGEEKFKQVKVVGYELLMRSMPSYNMTTKLQLTRSERMPSIRIVNVQGQQGQQ
ncbi:hypothetical protein T02_10809 [Trichinella nativa]|uniref:Uncharacterized protein n=1 Tax=Trichinella nativa TaxID=6335 RepID=A0A0V1KUB9_9BILA|nr:hypothetical protein T02_10809 [Trichinella nativa]